MPASDLSANCSLAWLRKSWDIANLPLCYSGTMWHTGEVYGNGCKYLLITLQSAIRTVRQRAFKNVPI